MVDVVGELPLHAVLLLHGVHGHVVFLLQPLHGLQALLVDVHNLARDFAQLVVGIVGGGDEVGTCGRALRKGAQHADVAPEMARTVIAYYGEHHGNDKHYPPEILAFLVEHHRYLLVERHHGVHLHAAVIAALRLVEEVGVVGLHVHHLAAHGVGHFGAYDVADVVDEASVLVHGYAHRLVQGVFLVVVAYEIDERQRIHIVLEGGYDTAVDELERLAHARVINHLHVVALPQAHAHDDSPHCQRERNKQLPVVTNVFP